MSTESMKLPKQWKDWCRSARLKPRSGAYKRGDWLYLRGHGREWRVSCHNMLQCGDTYAEFDRWALCDIRELPAPTTRTGFIATVRALVAAHQTQPAGEQS